MISIYIEINFEINTENAFYNSTIGIIFINHLQNKVFVVFVVPLFMIISV